MDNKNIVSYLKREIKGFDIENRISHSTNEATTRENLIHPFLEILEYRNMYDYTHEQGIQGGNKVDVSIHLGENKPIIFVECKQVDYTLNKNHIKQLNNYCNKNSSVKIALLTNGVIYNFYTKNKDEWNHTTPFFSFNIREYDKIDLETLANFCRQELDIAKIINHAQEIYFHQSFENAFFELVKNPSNGFIREIHKYMGGSRMNKKMGKKISSLINSYSVKNVYDKLLLSNERDPNSGIITTDKEMEFFHLIKGLLGSSNIRNEDLERIGFRDYKGCFNLLIDDSRQKIICYLVEKQNSYTLGIQGEKIKLDDLDIVNLKKYKSRLVKSANLYL
jgi:hypothetical protein